MPDTETFPYKMDGNLVEPKTWAVRKEGETKEIKYFDQEEMIELILTVAHAEGISDLDLDPDNVVNKFDSEMNLMYLAIPVKPEIARTKNCGGIWFIYTCVGEQGSAGIIRASSNIESPDEVATAEQVLTYSESENGWVQS